MIRHPLSAAACALLLAGALSAPLSALAVAKPKATVAAAPASDTPAAVSRDPSCATTRSRSADGRIGYFRHCPDSPDMVSFRGGSYRMGDGVGNGQGFEHPAHEVTIKPFAIGRYEVTRDEYQACVAAGGCTAPMTPPEATEAGARHPVNSVTWHQAEAYVAWLAQRSGRPYRLPTEAEWEYAARAGSEAHYTWALSQMEAVTCMHANALDLSAGARHPELTWSLPCDDGFPETAPVGSFPANRWGVHDMIGNVWEWVEDCWHPDYTGAPTDGRAWLDTGESANCKKRVNRGGGWGNGASALRLSSRDADSAGNHSSGLGFRVAVSVAAPPPAPTPAPAPAQTP